MIRKKYRVDYCGQKECYRGAKDKYCAGENVTLYFSLIATDTDYSFVLDDTYINVGFDHDKGFIISFIMPKHDVTLRCYSRNTMVEIIESNNE